MKEAVQHLSGISKAPHKHALRIRKHGSTKTGTCQSLQKTQGDSISIGCG